MQKFTRRATESARLALSLSLSRPDDDDCRMKWKAIAMRLRHYETRCHVIGITRWCRLEQSAIRITHSILVRSRLKRQRERKRQNGEEWRRKCDKRIANVYHNVGDRNIVHDEIKWKRKIIMSTREVEKRTMKMEMERAAFCVWVCVCCVGPTVVRSSLVGTFSIFWFVLFLSMCFFLSFSFCFSHGLASRMFHRWVRHTMRPVGLYSCAAMFSTIFSFHSFSSHFYLRFLSCLHSFQCRCAMGCHFSLPSDSVDDHRASTGHNSHSQQLQQQRRWRRRWQYVSPDRDVEANVSTRVTKESVWKMYKIYI